MLDPPEVQAFVESLFRGSQTARTVSDQSHERDAAGRAAWAALHSQHLGTPEWFETKWKPLIPTGCGCQHGANDLLAQCPPRYDSPEDWFAWTCQYHNLVNVKLGKPTLTLDEARAIWRP